MQIRVATLQDLPVLIELVEMLFALEHEFDFDTEKTDRGMRTMLDGNEKRTVLVAEENGAVVGMCTGQLLISTAMGTPSLWIEDVILRPQMRGRGVMPLLFAELEKWAVSKGATRVQLQCDMENEGGLAFYPKIGFQKTQLVGFHKFL